MSTEDRLARLGLLHLKDDPAALERALHDGITAYDARVAAWHLDRDRRLLARWSQWLALGERLGGGLYADVYATSDPAHVVKVARPRISELVGRPTASSALAGHACGCAFVTGSFGAADVDPNEVLSCEADVLRAAPATWARLVDTGEMSGRRFLVLERIEGTTLRPASGPSSFAPEIVLRIAQALAVAPILHGDIKPDNVMLTPAGDLRLLDPSSAWTQSMGGMTTRLLTTPLYNPSLKASDVPALGLMLAEALVGAPLLLLTRALPGPVRMTTALTDSIAIAENLGMSMGWLQRFRIPSSFPTPVEIDPKLEAVSLRALGLAWNGDALDCAIPYSTANEFARALVGIIGFAPTRARFHLEGRVACELRDGDSIVIGRVVPATLVLSDPRVARTHARVSMTSRGCAIEDLESPSGVFVNGLAVHKSTLLHDGDVVRVGGTELRLELVKE